ncbi:MAG TPA: glutamate 5-kinase, partial [Trueperaceae bacterium]|nr:glutamate 5-kinase [Trueperaceae bacterium]
MKPAEWRRVVVKVGTSSLTDADGHIEPGRVRAVAEGARALARAGAGGAAKLVIVSSGAGAAGRERLGLKLPLTLPEKQAAAAVGQVLLMQVWSEALAPTPVAQLLLSAGDIQERERYVNAKNALEAS